MPITVNNAMLSCTHGTAPCSLKALPAPVVSITGQQVATIASNIPFVNIPGFTKCISLANPLTAAATAAAAGVLTPESCIPMTVAAWASGFPIGTMNGQPVLTDNSTLSCSFGGTISIKMPGQTISTKP